MSKLKNFSSNRAITLIALIITIIVMLILVAVTVSIIVESDLIGSVEKAANAYKTAQDEEGTMGLKINGITYQSFEDYLVGSPHDWQYVDEETREEVQCLCAECTKENEEGIKFTIGQAVSYTGAGAGTSTITDQKSGVAQAVKDEYDGITASAGGKQTISKDAETTWVVFGIEDTNGSGENETLLLTTAVPTTTPVILYGADAYKYGPEEIDRMCKEIYGANARGMTIEDVNRTLGFEPTGGMYMDAEGAWHIEEGFNTPLSSITTLWSAIQEFNTDYREGKYYTPDYPNGTTDSSKLGNIKLDGYQYATDAETAEAEAMGTGFPTVPTTTVATVKTVVFGEENSYIYWLASRGVCGNDGYANFGPGAVLGGFAFSGFYSFYSNGFSYGHPFSLRPIVSLTSNIPE